MSFRFFLRRSIIPSVVFVSTATTAVVYGPWVNLKFKVFSLFGKGFQLLDPEVAHHWAIWAGEKGLFPSDHRVDPPVLRTQLWGRIFLNPIGLAAGFDKNAQTMQSMLDMGLGFVEVGSITPLPQEGNPKPRVFRIPEKKAVINRYGFNSDGIDVVSARLSTFRQTNPQAIVGVNLGVNKENARDWQRALRDYSLGVRKLGPFADYLVINISSPNTPGLRALQSRKSFSSLVLQVRKVRDEMEWNHKRPPPILVKISPDLTPRDKQDIAAVALHGDFDGLIISNTTITRPSLEDNDVAKEAGGLSGDPLFELSTSLIKEMYTVTKGSIPIIGCGGISTGKQAYEKIKAGASLVQLYTAMTYEGPSIIPQIKSELVDCLQQDDYRELWKAVGTTNHSK